MKTLVEDPKPSVLNLLLQTCVDGEEGYRLASESIEDAELKETLARYSAQRARFRQELKVLLYVRYEFPDDEPTMTGAVHHGWIKLKAIAKDGDTHAILVECVRGESAAIERYANALESAEVPADASKVARRQAMEIADACHRMEELTRRFS